VDRRLLPPPEQEALSFRAREAVRASTARRARSNRLASALLALLAFTSARAAESARPSASVDEPSRPTLDARRDVSPAQDAAPRAPNARAQGELPARDAAADAARRALERGLDFLAAQQAQDPEGAFALHFSAESNAAPASGSAGSASAARGGSAPLAVAALGALALMAGGSTLERGAHGKELGLVIDYLVAHTETDAKAELRGYIAKRGDELSRMHGHGFATLALAQAYSVSPHSSRGARIERALHAAIERIVASQGVEGGWYYEPVKSLQHEGSITICMVQALRAAHNSGFEVDPTTIARAVDYVGRSQNKDGSFRYALSDPESTVALTAAAIATLNASGTYSGPRIDEAYAWLFRALAARESAGNLDRNPLAASDPGAVRDQRVYCYFYERLYLAQALWQNPDKRVFDDWSAKERARVLTSQLPDGSWHDARFGDTYATAMNCLFLALPEGLLPVFQR
jgi:hypothetical protein